VPWGLLQPIPSIQIFFPLSFKSIIWFRLTAAVFIPFQTPMAIVSLCVQRLDPPCFNRLKNNSGRDDVELIAFADFTHPYNDKEVGIRDSIRNYRLILWGAKLHIFTGRTCFDTYLEKSILLDRKQIEVGYIPDASIDVSCDPAATQKLTFDSSFAKGSDERFSHAATCTEA
jgi:hypothetical protein